jgi:muramoyltetrapeptide carboxypeptidase LdcA involved in peptidoglycan recycling
VASVHGAMIDGRLAKGPSAYDVPSFLGSLGTTPLGEISPDGLDVLRHGEARGPLFGGTLMQLAASLGTPYEFVPPTGSVLFLEDVGERPYRIRRLLTQLSQSGRFSGAAAIVCGEFSRCDEPGGTQHRAIAAKRDGQIDRRTEIGLGDNLGARYRDLIFGCNYRGMALVSQPRDEVLEQSSSLGLVWLENEPDAH